MGEEADEPGAYWLASLLLGMKPTVITMGPCAPQYLESPSHSFTIMYATLDENLVTVPQTTLHQYDTTIKACQAIFKKKTQDYGTAWRILRLPSLTDQIMIKAKRIRMLQEQGLSRIDENIPTELIGIINYCIMSLMQITLHEDPRMDLTYSELAPLYDDIVATTRELLSDKNHDYQEAWRSMRVYSITDIILMKLLRIKRIEDNHGTTLVSEGVDANYRDIINYAVFALIQLDAIPH